MQTKFWSGAQRGPRAEDVDSSVVSMFGLREEYLC